MDETVKPYFSKECTTTAGIAAAGTSAEMFLTQKELDEFAPFDTAVITNLDNVVLAFNPNMNASTRLVVAANETKILDRNTVFRDFSITNLDAANAHTAGKVKILVQRFTKPSWM